LAWADSGSNRGPTNFDWHGSPISRETPVTKSYRNTLNVRRFFKAQSGDDFRFDRRFMAWLKDETPKTMGVAADEWLRRREDDGMEALRRYKNKTL
jgi:hypothetical protein